MLLPVALDEVLEQISCRCKRSKCSSNVCEGKSNGLNCSDMCTCSEDCLNQPQVSPNETSKNNIDCDEFFTDSSSSESEE